MTIESAPECSTGLSFKKFYERLVYCSYYKERATYIKGIENLFNRVLKQLKQKEDFLDIFTKEFSMSSLFDTIF
jgi:hypothetical protein